MPGLPPVWIRWRNQVDGHPRWHDASLEMRRTITWNVRPLTQDRPNIVPTIERLKRIARHYLRNHAEADAVLVEFSTEFRESDKEQSRISLKWFADRKTARDHMTEVDHGASVETQG